MWFCIAGTRRLSSSRFPQGPTASRPVGKLHTFGRVCGTGGQKYFSLPSLAAQLRAFLVLLPCIHKWLQRKRSLQAWYRLRLCGLLVRFFPFCQQLLFAAAHKPERPRAGRLFLSVTNFPCCRAPTGLACLIFMRMPTPLRGPRLHIQISKPVGAFPLQLQRVVKHSATRKRMCR